MFQRETGIPVHCFMNIFCIQWFCHLLFMKAILGTYEIKTLQAPEWNCSLWKLSCAPMKLRLFRYPSKIAFYEIFHFSSHLNIAIRYSRVTLYWIADMKIFAMSSNNDPTSVAGCVSLAVWVEIFYTVTC